MSRPSRYTELVALRLTPEQATWLDGKAPRLSRSEALRLLVDQAMTGHHPVVIAEAPVVATPAPTLAQTAPAPPIRTTASKIETVAEGKHLFRRGEVVAERWESGQRVRDYLCTCGCGEVRTG